MHVGLINRVNCTVERVPAQSLVACFPRIESGCDHGLVSSAEISDRCVQ